jgi:hypothetical protein
MSSASSEKNVQNSNHLEKVEDQPPDQIQQVAGYDESFKVTPGFVFAFIVSKCFHILPAKE